jgi:hypothetical protein
MSDGGVFDRFLFAFLGALKVSWAMKGYHSLLPAADAILSVTQLIHYSRSFRSLTPSSSLIRKIESGERKILRRIGA